MQLSKPTLHAAICAKCMRVCCVLGRIFGAGIQIVVLLVSVYCLAKMPLKGQSPESDYSWLFKRVQFNTSLSQGINRGIAEPISGPFEMQALARPVLHGRFGITVPVNQHLAVRSGIGLGAGFWGYVVQANEADPNYPMVFSTILPNNYLHLVYHIKTHQSWVPHISLGAESIYTANTGYGFSSMSASTLAGYSSKTTRGLKPFLHAGFGLTKPLKNLNLLSFQISYQYGLNNFYNGKYKITSVGFDDSFGNISSRLSHVSFTTGYAFTGARKYLQRTAHLPENKARLNQLRPKPMWDHDSARTKWSLNAGLAQQKTRINDPAGIFYEPFWPSGFYSLMAEHHINRHIFIEAGLGIMQYYTPFAQKGVPGVSIVSNYTDAQIIMGLGRALNVKGIKRSLLNVSGGLYFTVNNTANDQTNYVNDSGNDFYVHERKWGLMLYGAVSRDIWLSERLALNLSYRYVQGLHRVVREQFIFNKGPQEENRTVTMDYFGTFQGMSAGLKWDMGRPKPRAHQDLPAIGSYTLNAHTGWAGYRLQFTGNHSDPMENYRFNAEYFSFMAGLQLRYQIHTVGALESDLSHVVLSPEFEESFRINQWSGGYQYQLTNGVGNRLFDLNGGLGIGFLSHINGAVYDNVWENFFTGDVFYTQAKYDPELRRGSVLVTRVQNGDTLGTSLTNYAIERRVFPFVYIGASKEFKLYKNLYAGVRFRKQIGILSFFTAETISGNFNERLRLTGNANNILVSLSYRFSK